MAYLAPSLNRLFHEVNARWPSRDDWSDGWLGDSSHSSRFSDHNPDRRGMVHAADIDATLTRRTMGPGTVGDYLAAQILARCRDGRLDQVVSYVIYKGRIYSRPYGYASRAYTGANSHHSHVHISILYTFTAENYAGSWGIRDAEPPKEWDELASREEVRAVVDNALEAFAKSGALRNAVRVAIEAERQEVAQAVVNRAARELDGDTDLRRQFRDNVRVPVDAELTQRKLGT